MKRTFPVLFLALCLNSFLAAQSNPVSKSLCVYLKKVEKQTKLDTLLVLYDSPVLEEYQIDRINATKIIKVSTYQPDRMVVKLSLDDYDTRKRVVLTEQFSKIDKSTNELNIFTSWTMSFEFRVKNGKWKFLSKRISSI